MVTYVLQDQQLTPSKSEPLEGLKIWKGNSNKICIDGTGFASNPEIERWGGANAPPAPLVSPALEK